MKETLEFLNTLVTSAFCKQSMSSRKQNFFLFQEPDVSRRLVEHHIKRKPREMGMSRKAQLNGSSVIRQHENRGGGLEQERSSLRFYSRTWGM